MQIVDFVFATILVLVVATCAWMVWSAHRDLRARTGRGKPSRPTIDDEALAAFQLLSRLEGIIPALEPAHAIAKVMELAPKRPKDHLMVVNLSGRGDKDIPQVADFLRGKKK